MKRLKKISIILFATISLFLSINTASYAYNYEDYQTVDDWYIKVKENSPEAECSVTVYMFADVSDRNISNVSNHLLFDCVGGDALEGKRRIPLIFQFNPLNAKVYASLDGGEVWVWNFALENGDYEFSSPAGSESYGSLPAIYILDSGLNLPAYEDGYGITHFNENAEISHVENQDIRLYAVYGDSEWIQNNIDSFREWAETTECNFRGIEKGMFYEDEPVKEIVSVVTKTPTVTVQAENENEEIIIPSTNEDIAKENMADVTKIIKATIAAAILGIIVYISKKSPRNSSGAN